MLIALRTSAGKYLHSDAGRFTCTGDAPGLLTLVHLTGGKVMLQVPASGHFVNVTPDGVSTAADPGPQSMLRLSAQEDGAVAFLAPDGLHYLSAANGETVVASSTGIGEHERFHLEGPSAFAETGPMQGCCGTQPAEQGPGILWEKAAHYRVVGKAAELLEGLRAELPEVNRFIEKFWNNTTFRNHVFKGLEDADAKSPWKDNYWRSHFYNPRNGTNYSGSKLTTAQSEGRRCFGLSQHMGQRISGILSEPNTPGDILYKHAGYYLGLSLHFLTDLTQPMHAANFTNVWGFEGGRFPNVFDRRHAGFEVFADDMVWHFNLLDGVGPLTKDDVLPFTDAGSFLHDVADKARDVFTHRLQVPLRRKENPGASGGAEPPLYCENFWHYAEAIDAVRESLRPAPLHVARYLVNWSRRVAQDLGLSSDFWYSILEPTMAPANPEDLDKYEVAGMASTGSVRRWQWNKDDDSQRWFLHFNDDGTVCIGCKWGKDVVWYMWKDRNEWWVGRTSATDERNARFRIVPHDDKRFWIFEPTGTDAVAVKTEDDFKGYFFRFDPSRTGEQLFRFRPLATITTEERTEIQKKFPHFGKSRWWGARDVVPEWERGLGD